MRPLNALLALTGCAQQIDASADTKEGNDSKRDVVSHIRVSLDVDRPIR